MDCTQNQYYDSGGCHTCVQCPPGQELTEDCGYGYGALAHCKPCGTRWFKEAWGSHTCQMCQACRRVNRRELLPCAPTRNALCGECLPGYYSKQRLDGGKDLECMPCGTPPFRDPLCGRRRGLDVEKVWSPATMPQSTTTLTASICVAVVAMVILMSALFFVYHRYTLLRNLFKGCLTPNSRSNDAEVPTVSTETQQPVTQDDREEVSELIPTQATSDKESASSERDYIFPAFPAVLCDQGDCSYYSSGYASQPSSGRPTPPPALGLPAVSVFATGWHHCASGESPGWLQQQQRVPVECSELDIHESFPPGEVGEIHQTSTGPGLPRDNEPSLDLYSAAHLGSSLVSGVV